MSSSEVYAIANKCASFASDISLVIQDLESAKTAVNTDQLGTLPDAISGKLERLITELRVAIGNLASAASEANKLARQLEIEEKRRAEERRKRRAAEAAREKAKLANSGKRASEEDNRR